MHKYLCLLLTLLLFNCNQNNLENDILKIKLLQDKEQNTVIDSSLFYLRQSQKLIDKYDNIPDTLRIENLFRKGYYYMRIEKLDSASYYYHRAIDLVKGPNTRKRNHNYFRHTWQTDESIGNIANGISVAQKFVEISNLKDHADALVFAYNFLERMHLDLRSYEKSLMYNSKGTEAALEASNMDMFLITTNSKVNTLYNYLGEKEAAFKLLDSLKPIKVSMEAKSQFLRTYGVLNYYEGKYENAIKDYKSVLKISKSIEKNYNYNLLECYNNIAEAYLALENYPMVEKYLDSSKAMINPNSFQGYINSYNKLRFRYNYRTKLNEQEVLDEYKALVDDYKKQHELNINEKLTALTLSYKKEQEAIAKKNEEEIKNLKLSTLIGVLGVLILIGYLFYRQRRFKFERESLQMQQRLLRSQMNPHFIFNTLSVIQNQVKENKDGAVNYLLKFSRLLRLILENSLNDYVQIENELESLRKYLDLQLIRFPEKFNYTITIENFEEDELLFIPPMLIQPFVENSIEHGFLGINYEGQIDIKLILQEKWISCVIEDNGTGLKASNSNLKNSVSINLISKFIKKTTKQQISIINKKTEDKNTSGVLIKFLIPYKFSEHD